MENKDVKKVKGTVGARMLVWFLSIVFGILCLWLLNLIHSDLRRLPEPTLSLVEKQFPEIQKVSDEITVTRKQVETTEKEIALKKERLKLLDSASKNTQSSLDSLLKLKDNKSLTDAEKEKISEYIGGFLKTQDEALALHEEIQKLSKANELSQKDLEKLLARKTELTPELDKRYGRARELFRIRVGVYQLLVLLPFTLVAAFLLLKKRASHFYPIYLAYSVAVLLQVSSIAHHYFSSRFTRYILLLAVLVVILMLLVHIIRQIAKPKRQMLQKQYRQAYEKYICPTCEYPIQAGPFKFAIRNKKGKIVFSSQSSQSQEPLEPYVCPSCGERLFEKCSNCGKIRHSLLDYCEHCGNAFEVKQM